MTKTSVLFVCIHNSARSQMAEALLKHLGQGRFEVESAGLEPGTLNPLAVEAMRRAGIDIASARPQSVFDLFRSGRRFHYVISVCDEASAERCPIFPGVTKRLGWSFPDPADLAGTPAERLDRTIAVRDAIHARLLAFIQELDGDGASAVRVAPALPAMRPAVLDLLRASDLPVDDSAEPLENYFVARSGSEVVGCAGLELTSAGAPALFRSLAVQPAWRHRGIARRLFDEARRHARILEIPELYLLTDKAAPLFEGWGFAHVSRSEAPLSIRQSRQFTALCPESAAVMRISVS